MQQCGFSAVTFSVGRLEMATWKQAGSVSSSWDQDWPFFLTAVHPISPKQSLRTEVGMGLKSQDFLGIQVFSYKLNSVKIVPENSTGLVRIGLSGSKLLLISSVLCTKNSLNYQEEIQGKYLREA